MRQSEHEQQQIKGRVRSRDGHKCVVCGLGEVTHRKRYGKTLDVHRIVHDSEYAVKRGVCVTMCEVCHDAMHDKGNWWWILSSECDYSDTLAGHLRRAIRADVRDERAWQRRAAWGARLRALRTERGLRTAQNLAISADLEPKDVEAFEDGRREPTLFELKGIAKALRVRLDTLAEEDQTGDEPWLEACERRVNLRAITFRARDPEEGESLYCGEAKRILEVVLEAYSTRVRIKASDAEYWNKRNQETRDYFFGKRTSKLDA